ncbi:hypothetical protein PVAND_002333 [Polypedilum vanderplanki]|uniref:alpha-glucosidase n=1 Tax=Polypedilum vanderplanki TaxID=319348 RepID=A0A9J6BQX2_POLVA|nr:hypothetical protein PVAND_002333 [Polypedilum vanderplanki]
MSEEKLNSNKLDFETKRQSLNNQEDNRESYKPISEDSAFEHVTGETVKNSNMVREKSNEHLQDGADEKMLGSDDKETLALKSIEVKFIPSDQNQNGDAKIEIENGGEKTFTGMTKEELMKYANDPFWIKLRWFLFVLFWLAWIGMLVGAIAIIVLAPKCAAPTPLVWYKKGPLAKIESTNVDDSIIEKMKEFEIQGVIYELPSDATYKVESGQMHDDIKEMVKKFKAKDIHVVIDLTPNVVTEDDQLFKDALKGSRESFDAFVTNDKQLNWIQVDGTKSAWKKFNNTYFLNQFGDYYDIRLNKPIVQNRLTNVIKKLTEIGVKGFRFVNAKYIVTESEFIDEIPNSKAHGLNKEDFGFYMHSQREFSQELKDIILYYNSFVLNVTNDEGFLAIRDDISNHIESFVDNKRINAFELPRFGFITKFFHDAKTKNVAKSLFDVFENLSGNVDLSLVWTQIQYTKNTYNNFEESAYKLFISFLRGVQIAPFDDLVYIDDDNGETYNKLKTERASRATVFEHGNFNFYLSNNTDAFAYSRVKPGNPGIFVVVNPTNEKIRANFSSNFGGSDLSMLIGSKNFGNNLIKSKINPDNIELPQQSTAIFTFVPE